MGEAIGIVGLGRMGLPASKLLIRKGYRVVGYDRDKVALDEFAASGGNAAPDVKTVAEKAETIIVFVLNDAQVKAVVVGENGLLAGVHDDSCIVCMSTIRKAELERVAAQCTQKNVAFVDCPCTGGPVRAGNGTLTLGSSTGMVNSRWMVRPI